MIVCSVAVLAKTQNCSTGFSFLKNKWNDGFTRFWIVFEFVLVVSVLAQCPNSHLIETSCGKYACWHAVCQDRKEYPRTDFVGVVWT